MTAAKNIFQLKITLYGSSPSIWRKIQVPETFSFFDLHVAIQDSFGWEDDHLHQYFTENPYKRNSQYQNIALPMPEMDVAVDERKAKLKNFLRKPKDYVFYEYDFGDSWMHEVKLEKILPADKKRKYPILLDGKRACPEEDSGGLGGYYNLLDIINNPKHPEYEDMLNWMGLEKGSEYNPEKIDLTKIRFRDPKRVLKWFEKQFEI